MDNRIDDMDERLRKVELAVCSLGELAKYLKFGVVILAASLGLDLGGAV